MTTNHLIALGHARVYRDSDTGELVVDTDSLRRSSFAGLEGFSGYDDYDDFEGYDDDDFEGYDDDFGLFRRDPERRDSRRRRRLDRKRGRAKRKYDRKSSRLDRKEDKWGLDDEEDEPRGDKKSKPTSWGMTAIGGTDTLTAAGSASVRIRLQHDFQAEDVTFTGSAPGAMVNSIFFGDRVVWSAPDGIDVSVFASNSFLRGLLKGQSLTAGLDVTINGSLPDIGDFKATLTGRKPNHSC